MKRKLFLLLCALLTMIGVQAQPTASTPVVGNTYYLYNPTTKLFMTTNVDLPFIRPTGSAWKLEAAAENDGYVTLRLADNETDGCGYFWGKWWANNPNQNSSGYANERVYKLVNSAGGYKLQSYAWETESKTSYIYINNGNEGDRSYRLACNSHDQAGLDEGYVTWQFISEADYATYMADDYTSRISNNDFLSGVDNWTLGGSGNKQAHGNTAIEYWNASAASGSFDYYQNLTNLPAGKYVLRAAMYNSTNGEEGASFNTAGQCGVYGTSNGVTKNANVTVDGTAYNIYTTDALLVPDGNLRLGFKNSTTMTARWFGADWIQLTCIEYCLSTVATALPAGGAMEADTWYYYDLPTSDEYEFTLSDAATLTYSADGAQLISEATGSAATFTASETKNFNLSAGRLYFKTDAATSLNVSYKYSVGTATASVSYVQGGETVPVTWSGASSNNPNATFAKKGTPVITFNGNNVEVANVEKGFTFTVPGGLTANTEYTLAIPAAAFGYAAGPVYNEAQNITLKTPALFDGTYFFRVAATYNGSAEGTSAAVGKYLSRGCNYGTQTTVDKYGLAVQVSTNSDNVSYLKMADSQAYIYHATNSSWNSFADRGSADEWTEHTITLSNGKYRISSNKNAGKYFKYNDSSVGNEEIPVYDDGTGANAGPIILWAIETVAEHTTALQTMKDNQAASAAAAAYASGNYASLNGITTVAALETALTSGYISGEFVSPSTISSVREEYQPRGGASATEPVTVYSSTINITEAGFYKFSMQAFFRATDNVNTQASHTAGTDFPGAVLFFGDSETQIKSLYDDAGDNESTTNFTGDDSWKNDVQYNEKYYANCTDGALTRFQNDKYHNDVWFYCSTPGEYTYGVKVMGYANAQWFIYSPESVTITSYAAEATTADYTALQNAIDAYDGASWGFEAGEYAPYNNTSAIENITAAKAINSEVQNSQLLVRSLTANLALTENDAEVNAVYNPTFALSTNNMTAVGWSTNDDNVIGNEGGDSHSRAFVLTSGTDYDRLAALGQGDGVRSAFYTRYDGTNSSRTTQYIYGTTSGYTMPLKAQKYRIAVDALGWNQDGSLKVALVNNEGTVVNAQTETTNNVVSNASAKATHFVFVADVPAAGNYKLVLSNGNDKADYAVVVSNISIMSAPASVTVTLDGTTGYATFGSQYPLNLIPENLATGVKAYKATTVDGENITFEALEQGVPANTGLLIAGEPGQVVTIPVATSTSAVEGNLLHVNASGETFDAESGYSYYGLKKGTKEFRPFAPGTVAIPANKAYLKVENASGEAGEARLVIFFDDDSSTAINAIEAAKAEAGTLKDGKYLENGKIVIVKNGVKYSANGQILK